MSDTHSLLDACWTTGDTTPLLVLADMLDEQADPDAAELLRLTVANGQTARHDRTRDMRLRHLRGEIWKRVRETSWPDMAMQTGAAVSFSRRPNANRPDREHILVRADRQTIHQLLVRLDKRDEVIFSRDGRELLRHRLPAESAAMIRKRGDLHWCGAFTLADTFFPLDGQPADRRAAEAEQLRRFETAVEPARLSVAELPVELVPIVAWLLAEHLADRPRRARVGEPVPGAHFFVFRNGEWLHGTSLDNRDSGRAAELLRRRVRWEHDRGVLAGLLVRVTDGGKITARKLVWIGVDGYDQETANLSGATATLSESDYRRVTDELELDEAAFVLDSPEKLRGLFVAS